MQLSIIVAYSKNRVIGRNNQLPWHLPADLKHFKTLTMGKPIVMGRKTFESIGKPLPGRRNIVISRSQQFDGCENFSSIEEVLQALSDEKEVMMIGGTNLFSQVLSIADCIYATEIDAVIEGDAFFPALDNHWEIVSQEPYSSDEKNIYSFRYVTYCRK